MTDFFLFEKMLTPKIINLVYWFLIAAVIVGGLSTMFAAKQFLTGLVAIVVGIIGARISCELLIVVFKMNEALQDIRSRDPV